MEAGGDDSVQYEAVVGLNTYQAKESGSEVSCGEDSDSDSAEEESKKFVNSRRPRHEDKESKKLRKQAVKDSKAEKRKDKVKKHVKKRKEQSGKKAT